LPTFALIVATPAWRHLIPNVEAVARRATRAAGTGATILLADDRTVRHLNARDRGKDKPTNVLTYDPPGPGLPGQIVLALGVLRREAAAAGRLPAHHLAHLIVHGALHLCGADHERAGEARRMEMAEARILRRIGVPNPWKPRDGGAAPAGTCFPERRSPQHMAG
jgi:probable rRNA maturation factor